MNMRKGKIMAFEGPGIALSEQVHDLRALQPGEILVRNLYTTICGSDLHTFCGIRKEACPTVLGHEITGRIMEIGAGHRGTDSAGNILQIGDTVTWSVFSSDETSELALRGMPQKGQQLFKYGHAKIENAEVFHGGLSEYCFLKKGTAILKIPPEMPLPVAATINCAIATVAGAIRLAGNIKGKRVLISGAGLLGLACAAMCREDGADDVVLADIDRARLKQSLNFGANNTINLRDDASGTENNSITGFDIAFDMSGAPDAMEYGLSKLTVGGVAVWVGAVFSTRKVEINAESIIRNIITIKGLHNYNFQDFSSALDFMSLNWNKYPFASIVEKEFPLSRAHEAFEFALASKPIRVGVRI